MEFTALVLYDFSGETESELSLREGDVVTVENTEIGEGWWYGRSAGGSRGVFPATYVERTAAQPIENEYAAVTHRTDSGWGGEGQVTRTRTGDSWGDEWSDDDSSTSAPPPAPAATPKTSTTTTTTSIPLHQTTIRPAPSAAGKGGFKLGKISNFGKSGVFDSYLTGGIEAAATNSAEAVHIEERGGGFHWMKVGTEYTCTIGVAKKGAKFGGFKAYMTYPVTPSFNNIQVSRRYKHFDWLHERLTEKFGAVISIPPLPDKQVTGRFEEELIENRRIELQSFVDRICRHPVLSNCAVWMHFISETDEKRWTSGKRRAESDPLVEAAFLTTLQVPELETGEQEIEEFGKTLAKLEPAVKEVFSAATNQSNRIRSVHKKDLQTIGASFNQLGLSLNQRLPALEKIGEKFKDLGELCENQATRVYDPLVHLLHDYRGLTGSWSDILSAYSTAKDRQKEIESGSGDREKMAAQSRINTYRIGVMAEINYFIEEINVDLNLASQTFVVEEIKYHQERVDALHALYADCWGQGGGPVESLPPPPASDPNLKPSPGLDLDPWGNATNIYEEMP